MNILFLYPKGNGGITTFSKDMIKVLKKENSDLNIIPFKYEETKLKTIDNYLQKNKEVIARFYKKNNKLMHKENCNLIHIEFDYSYFGFKFNGKPFIDLLKLIQNKKIPYSISLHNDYSVFEEAMKKLGKDTSKFKEEIELIKKNTC